MRKSLKKVIASVLAVAAMTSMMASCGEKNTADGEVKEVSIFLKMMMANYSPDMPIWKEAEERTGIRLKNVASDVAEYPQALATMLASGKLPDMIWGQNADLRGIADDGGFIALDEYIEEYGPNIKKYFDAVPEAAGMSKGGDGKTYFLPGSGFSIDLESMASQAFFIRQDWLDKLNLKTPTTIQEYHDVLMAFKTQDPNGNGKKDEIPYFSRNQQITPLLCQLYRTNSGYALEDGKVVYGPVSENYKRAMKELSVWFEEGLIDNEIFTRANAREALISQNIGGATNDWIASTSNVNSTLATQVPGLEFVAMEPPKDIAGKATNKMLRPRLSGYGVGITKDAKEDDIIDLVKYLDFWMSEDGCELMSFGTEGVAYTFDDDGNRVFSDEALGFSGGFPAWIRTQGNIEFANYQNTEAEFLSVNEYGAEGFRMYENNGENIGVFTVFTDEEQKVIDKYYVNMKTYVDEMMQKFLFGKVDVDKEWDSYVKKLEGMGLDEVTKVYTASYKRTNGK